MMSRTEVSESFVMAGTSVTRPRRNAMTYTRPQAMVRCRRMPGTLIHVAAFCRSRTSWMSRTAPPSVRMTPTSVRTMAESDPGMKHAPMPVTAAAIPMMMTSHERRIPPKGVFPSVMTCSATITRKSPYVLSGAYGSTPAEIRDSSRPKMSMKAERTSRMTGSSVKSNSLFGAGPCAGACALSMVMRVISGLAAGLSFRSQ